MRSAPPLLARRRGFTLVEVLVAVVVMAIGMLGVLGLRLVTLKQGANTQARSVAAVHAADILDRMRANPQRAVDGRYNLGIDAATPVAVNSIADQDLQQWRRTLGARLADGAGGVAVNGGGLAEVEIRWVERDNQASDGSRTLRFTFRSQL